ncbi:hypothetical protein [Streptomyces sp. NPDC002133]|uniref:hypothetical protein n=1 Tax=Streptomyces sp. NPDC002133 TaxID=3154409 RepID=UPI00332C6CD9
MIDFGGPDALVPAEAPEPEARPGRVVVDVAADGGRFSVHGAPTGGFAAADPCEAERRDLRPLGIADVRLSPPAHAEPAHPPLAAAASGALRPVIGAAPPWTGHRALMRRSSRGAWWATWH